MADARIQTTRRDLLKGAAIGAAGVAAVASLSTVSTAQAAEAELQDKYDVDILVVGGGVAGYCAAIQLIELGEDPSQILMIDKMSGEGVDYGGSSLLMGGNYLMASDTSDEGKVAFAEAMYDIADRLQNMDMLTTLAENANDGIEWLISLGCGFGDPSSTEYEAAVTRTMTNEAPVIPSLMEAYAQRNGKIVYGTRAWKLNIDANGICGVLASDADGFFNIAAKKVILATGGFLSNPGMLEDYIGDNAGLITSRAPWSITGDGQTMVKEVGGTMAPLSHGVKACYLSCTSVDNLGSGHASRVSPYCIAINAEGKRYWNETDTGQTGLRDLMEQPGCTMGMVSDSKQTENLQAGFARYEEIGVPIYTFDTIEEVAELFGCPADALQATIDEFNAHVVGDHTEGLDPDKTSDAMTIDTPPYYAFYPFKLTSSFLGAGIVTDTSAHVMAADGTVIPNLLAAGEIQGGFAYDEYFHGANNAKGTVFGRIAANTAYNEL